MLSKLQSYGRFVKIEHTLFSLPLLFSGAVLAGGRLPPWPLWGLIVSAGFGARTAAFAINRLVDRHIDAKNPRTANRELPRRVLSTTEAIGIGLSGTLIYIISAWTIAPICLYASPLPLALFVLYPYMKRFTWTAHFGVGTADAMAPLGGWVAVTRAVHPFWPGFCLALFMFLWVAGFDIIYATMDEAFDRAEGLHSIPARWGSRTAFGVSALLHVAAMGVLLYMYCTFLTSYAALAALGAIGALLYWEHRHADNIDLAFFKINAVIGFGVLGFVALGVAR